MCFTNYTLQAIEKTNINSNSTDNVISSASHVSVVPNNTTEVAQHILDGRTGKLRRRSRSSTVPRNGSFFGSRAQPRMCLRSVKSVSPRCDTVSSEPTGDVSELQNSPSSFRHGCCCDGTQHTTEGSSSVEQAFRSECHDTVSFPHAQKFSPLYASFHHSTPEDTATGSQMIGSNESESMCLSRDECPYEDIDTSMAVRNALSWHDSLNAEPSPSRSCVSLDDSLFLRDLNVEGSNEAELLATCTAVSSLEQLEQEVAGVLSDCGDIERCFGLLRHDSVKAVVGRYSLGVADSVLAGDKCARWQDSTDSPITNELSLSSSVGIVRHSGFMWDDDGFDTDSPCTGFVPVSRRATRSLSPLPAVRHQQADCRSSLGSYADARVIGKVVDWTDIDNNMSTDLAPCSVYDVNRRLSGRLHVQHISD